ncbi:hypothetical protein NL676_016109 [Syzygium grande]|nr:hypothetical protein NL676_016109 [Syzygium grande]
MLNRFGGVDLIERHSPILSFDMDGQLIPRVEFLLELSGGDDDATGTVMRKLPAILKYLVEHLESHVEFLRSFAGLIEKCIGSFWTSCGNIQKVIELFLSYGFSCEDVLLMSKKHPHILQYNPDSLEEKVECIVGKMGSDLDELLDFPAFLGYKLDSRIMHRNEVKKKIIGEGMSLNNLLSVSYERFAKEKLEELAHNA